MSSLIKLKDINKYYKVGKEKFHVLKSLNINIEEGDFVMIMGKSGSGKTTLLNVLAFLDKFDTGSYFFNYENVSNLNENQRSVFRNKYIGFIFQQYVFSDYTHISCPVLHIYRHIAGLYQQISNIFLRTFKHQLSVLLIISRTIISY